MCSDAIVDERSKQGGGWEIAGPCPCLGALALDAEPGVAATPEPPADPTVHKSKETPAYRGQGVRAGIPQVTPDRQLVCFLPGGSVIIIISAPNENAH